MGIIGVEEPRVEIGIREKLRSEALKVLSSIYKEF